MASRRSRQYRRYVDAGMCGACGQNPLKEGSTRCVSCGEAIKNRQRAAYARAKELGFCVKCKKVPSLEGMTVCQPCREKESVQRKARWAKGQGKKKTMAEKERRMEIYWQRKAAGLCVTCGRHVSVLGRTRCTDCAEKAGELSSRRHKAAVASGLCVGCRKAPVVVGMTRCEPCRRKRIEQLRAERAMKEATPRIEGVHCIQCGFKLEAVEQRTHKPAKDGVCAWCLDEAA